MQYGTRDPVTGKFGDFGTWDDECEEITPEQMRNQLERMREQLEDMQPPDTVLVNHETFAKMMFFGFIYEDGKEFWYETFGHKLRVVVSAKVPIGNLVICRWKDVYADVEADEPADCSGMVGGKMEPKMVHCRVCGAGYYSKNEAKQCQRSHEWQNRKGRR